MSSLVNCLYYRGMYSDGDHTVSSFELSVLEGIQMWST